MTSDMKGNTKIDSLGCGNRIGAISRRAFLRGTACAALAGAGACTGMPAAGARSLQIYS